MKRIAVLGSTGSIGTQALEIVRSNREELEWWLWRRPIMWR